MTAMRRLVAACTRLIEFTRRVGHSRFAPSRRPLHTCGSICVLFPSTAPRVLHAEPQQSDNLRNAIICDGLLEAQHPGRLVAWRVKSLF